MKTLILRSSSLVIIATALLFAVPSVQAQTGTTNVTDDARAYMEMLRSDFNATKIRTINQTMKLTAPEADKFWPIYRDYEKELAAVGDRKLDLIRDFFKHYKDGTLDDKMAKKMSEDWLNINQARLDLWKKYSRKISKAVSPIRAAQYLQVENQLALFVDMSIASEMPSLGTLKSVPAAK
jgi:hypothetical protein